MPHSFNKWRIYSKIPSIPRVLELPICQRRIGSSCCWEPGHQFLRNWCPQWLQALLSWLGRQPSQCHPLFTTGSAARQAWHLRSSSQLLRKATESSEQTREWWKNCSNLGISALLSKTVLSRHSYWRRTNNLGYNIRLFLLTEQPSICKAEY